MAKELTINMLLHFLKGDEDKTFPVKAKQFDVTGTKCIMNRQAVGNTAEALDIGDMTTPGFFIGVNTDATYYIEMRDGADGADLVKLKAGEPACFRLTTTTPYVISNAGTPELQYMIVEN